MTDARVLFSSAVLLAACRGSAPSPTTVASVASGAEAHAAARTVGSPAAAFTLPLVPVVDVPLPGRAVRFDYQDLDVTHAHLVIAHMNDASVVIVNSSDGSVVKVLTGIPSPRGVVVAADVQRLFVTSSPNRLVIIDTATLTELARVETGNGPDGVAWDKLHQIVAVSDQADGSISLRGAAGRGGRKALALGSETGNVVFDAARGWFWITVVRGSSPDELVAVDPVAIGVVKRIALAGCDGAHGLQIHPDGRSALVACEGNSQVARVALEGENAVEFAASGRGPDVLAIDPVLGWLYVAAESGDLRVFDLAQPGLVTIDREHIAQESHTVAVDVVTHRVFFPLASGPKGTPVLRILRPGGG